MHANIRMSTALATADPPERKQVKPAVDLPKPVLRPRQSTFKLVKEVLQHGGPGYLQFAITNICNAKCDFCGFALDKFDPKKRRSVTLQEAQDVIDIAARNRIGYLLFVGGEPLAHRNLSAMVRYAAERGIHPMICTNGSLWTDQNMRELANNGLTSVIMSIDSHDVTRHEKNRGLPEVCRKIKRANEVFAELGIQTTASVTASKLIDDYEQLPAFLAGLGFPALDQNVRRGGGVQVPLDFPMNLRPLARHGQSKARRRLAQGILVKIEGRHRKRNGLFGGSL